VTFTNSVLILIHSCTAMAD